jgi:hypothetical protein
MSDRPEAGRRRANSFDNEAPRAADRERLGRASATKKRERHGASVELRKTVLLAATHDTTGARGRVRAQVEISANNPANCGIPERHSLRLGDPRTRLKRRDPIREGTSCSPRSGATTPTTRTSWRSTSAPCAASSKRTARASSTPSAGSATDSTRDEDRLALRPRHPYHPRRARDRPRRRCDCGHSRLPRQARRRPPQPTGQGRRVR